jgi:hypothetical protein
MCERSGVQIPVGATVFVLFVFFIYLSVFVKEVATVCKDKVWLSEKNGHK